MKCPICRSEMKKIIHYNEVKWICTKCRGYEHGMSSLVYELMYGSKR